MANAPSATVLGIGNLLWADEGFGVRCVERLDGEYEFGPGLDLVDGGTQGLCLLGYVQAAQRLLIFDAVDFGLPPGQLVQVRDDDVPRYLGARKMSLHQTGFQEVLQLAEFTGRFPREVVLLGCQPEELEDYGGSLRPSVRAAIGPALEQALAILARWGFAARRRAAPLDGAAAVTLPTLSMRRYEQDRPSAEAACRIGDERFLPRAAPQAATEG
ncbi:HyaD/HybD family hydrogenase maturation endopeptidase [Frateuria defendens]|uniref:HyaD/HybD family hydrogenase maturation endopeptidase n=1 Tax=Frateuria defendens TaxID=2219559 RepID=UPI00066FD8A3|nr:HyaD/HybD family hydrogenase maturation endopeptidase [Frateuria defendens]